MGKLFKPKLLPKILSRSSALPSESFISSDISRPVKRVRYMASQYIGEIAPAQVTHKYIPIYSSPKWITFDRFLLATLASRGKVCFEIGNHILTKLVARHLWNLECIIGLILGNKEGMLQTISYPNLVTPEFCLYFCQLHLLVCLIVCSKNTITSLDNWAWYLNLNIAVKHLV